MIAFGKKVTFDYVLTVAGKVVDSSEGKRPLEYLQGGRGIISGLARQMLGLKVGDERVIKVAPAEGYGEVIPDAFQEVPKSKLPKETSVHVGSKLNVKNTDGTSFPVLISEVRDETVVIDFNNPLAGKELSFEIKIISVE